MSSNLADRERMNQLIDLEIEYDEIPIPTPLCKCHYYTIYNLIQPQQNKCPTCGVNLKHVTSRPCPNAEVVKDHLRRTQHLMAISLMVTGYAIPAISFTS